MSIRAVEAILAGKTSYRYRNPVSDAHRPRLLELIQKHKLTAR